MLQGGAQKACCKNKCYQLELWDLEQMTIWHTREEGGGREEKEEEEEDKDEDEEEEHEKKGAEEKQ